LQSCLLCAVCVCGWEAARKHAWVAGRGSVPRSVDAPCHHMFVRRCHTQHGGTPMPPAPATARSCEPPSGICSSRRWGWWGVVVLLVPCRSLPIPSSALSCSAPHASTAALSSVPLALTTHNPPNTQHTHTHTPRRARFAELLAKAPWGDKSRQYFYTREEEYVHGLRCALGIW
jgi:hypothetical protein